MKEIEGNDEASPHVALLSSREGRYHDGEWDSPAVVEGEGRFHFIHREPSF
jgi:hypothetical protein